MAALIDVTTVDGVTLVTMQAGENRFDLPFVTALERTLLTAGDEGRPLVLTGVGKFFSNGLDLEWLTEAGPDGSHEMMVVLHRVLAGLLAFPGATVAAVNGHAFGAGAILAAAADMRVMRQDRGYFCFPEVDLGLPMSDEFDAVLRAKYPPPALLRALLTGARLGGTEARDLVGKAPATVAALKSQQHKPALAILDAGS